MPPTLPAPVVNEVAGMKRDLIHGFFAGALEFIVIAGFFFSPLITLYAFAGGGF